MPVSLGIGPSGQPPSTTYTYDLGAVTLSARPQTVRSPAEVTSIVKSIRAFVHAVRVSGPQADVDLPAEPFEFSQKRDDDEIPCKFKCPTANPPPPHLTLEATIDTQTMMTTFAERPERTIAWGDFLLFVAWMEAIRDLVNR